MAAKKNARGLLATAPYDEKTLYSSLWLGAGKSVIDAEKTKYIGMTKDGHYAFRDEAAPHHIVRKVPASGTTGALGIVLHKDLHKIQMLHIVRRNNNSNNNNNTRNRKNAKKARATRRRLGKKHGHNNSNTENE